MSSQPISSRKSRGNKAPVERIIPIQIEGRDDDESVSSTSDSVKQAEAKITTKLTSREQPKVISAVQLEIKPESTSKVQNKDKMIEKPEGKELQADSKPESTSNLQNKGKRNEKLDAKDSFVVDDNTSSEGSELSVSVSKLSLSPDELNEIKQKKENDNKIKLPENTLPPYNVPEKIIIVLDRAKDEVVTCFEMNNGTKYSPLYMLKNSLMFLLHNKNIFDTKHEFALIVLNENSASWVHDFTNDINSIIQVFELIEECVTEDIFDMNTVFDLINKKVNVPLEKEDLDIPPPYIVRTVFLYGRSFTMPEINMTEEIDNLLKSPYFTFDVLMTHEVPDSSNRCNTIFTKLQKLDTKGFAYFFPVSRSSAELHLAIAKLLSHPLQRPCQKIANYKLNLIEKI